VSRPHRNGPCCTGRIRTTNDPPFQQRRTIRLPGRDYSADGAYFVTVCTVERGPVLGAIVDGQIRLNALGDVVADTWRWLTLRYPDVTLDEWCVMPDHLHGILVLGELLTDTSRSRPYMGGSRADMGGTRAAPTGDTVATDVDAQLPRRKPIGGLIGAFKTVSTKRINGLRNTPGALVWQRDFWDHIVRDDPDLHRIRAYIRDNVYL
jgi:putative transposase